MLKYNLKKIFELKGITKPMGWMMRNGFTLSEANRLASEGFSAMKPKHLERLCYLLNCTPNDLMEWKPDSPEQDKLEHALQGLKNEDEHIAFEEVRKKMKVSELKETIKSINSN